MSKKVFENSRIRSVTIMPCFLLKLQGRLDSRKGESVAQAHIDKLKDKCSQHESEECKSAENKLAGSRAKASEALEKLRKARKSEKNVPDSEKANDVFQLRENQRRSAEKKRIQAEAEAQYAVIYEVRPRIIHVNTVLAERVNKTRKKAMVKIDAYVKGLRSGKLAGFEPDLSFNEDAFVKYHLYNDPLDEAINRIANYEEVESA